MAHKVVGIPKKWLGYLLSSTCELQGIVPGPDPSPCSHVDYCTRVAVVWLSDGGPPFGLCNECYSFCYPTKEQRYRVYKISENFRGKL